MFLLGLDDAAIEAAGLDQMSNEELVALIDGYIEANGGSVPEVLARDALESGETDGFFDGPPGFGEYDMFEGCPA